MNLSIAPKATQTITASECDQYPGNADKKPESMHTKIKLMSPPF